MLKYERIDISDGIDVHMSNKSKECMLCHYWYFLDINFSYGPYLCEYWYDISQISADFKNIAITHVKISVYRIYFFYMSKHEAKTLMTNSNLIHEKGILLKKNIFFFIMYIKMNNTTYYKTKKR